MALPGAALAIGIVASLAQGRLSRAMGEFHLIGFLLLLGVLTVAVAPPRSWTQPSPDAQ